MGFFSNLFGGSAEGQEKFVYIQGMMCQNCAEHVTEPLLAVPGVLKVNVNLPRGRATLRVTGDVVEKDLLKAVVNAGYGVSKITEQKED